MVMANPREQLVNMMAQIYAGLYKRYSEHAMTEEELLSIDIGWSVSIVNELPAEGARRTFYFIRGEHNTTQGNIYNVYIWVETAESTPEQPDHDFELIGQVKYDMRNHYTVDEFETILLDYVDKIPPISHNASDYENDSEFVKVYYTPVVTNKSKLDVSIDEGVHKYNLSSPTEATMSELNNYFSKTISSDVFNNCIDITTNTIRNALSRFNT